jgi:hypothetical protein
MHKCFNSIPCLLLSLGVLYEVKPERLMWRQLPYTTCQSYGLLHTESGQAVCRIFIKLGTGLLSVRHRAMQA